MPLIVDHTKKSDGQYGAVYFDTPIYGANELTNEQTHFNVRGYQHESIWPNARITNDGRRACSKDPNFIAGAHAWLSQNVTSPWYLREGWSNHGHSYDCNVFIENFAERDKFAAAHQKEFDLSTYDWDMQLWGLAVLKGIIPAVSVNHDPALWLVFNQGYLPKWDAETYNIYPEYKTLEKELVAEWVDNKKLLTAQEDGSYSCPMAVDSSEEFRAWLGDHSRMKWDSLTYPLKVSFRCKELEAKFVETWGETCPYDAGLQRHVIKLDRGNNKPRIVPQHFKDYLHGKGEDLSPKDFKLPAPLQPVFTS